MPKLFSVGPNQGNLLLQGFSMKSENNLISCQYYELAFGEI